MRNDFTPIETCEIDDAELDNVSGGLLPEGFPLSVLPFGSLPEPVGGLVHTITGGIPAGVPSA
jgi:hypothetical protein